MIPLLSVGLIMGTRLWYAMWNADKDDEAAFELRLDSVVREIGERGKLVLPEAVTPLREPALAPAPAAAAPPVPTPGPAPDLAPALPLVPTPAPIPTSSSVPRPIPSASAPTLAPTVARVTTAPTSPAIHQSPSSQVGECVPSSVSSSMSCTLGELTVFMEKQQLMLLEQQRTLLDREKKLEQKLEQKLQTQAEREEKLKQKLEQKLEAQAAEFRRELKEQREHSEDAARIWQRNQQLSVLQTRLETLHGANLLDEEALFLVEDAIADSEDVGADGRISKLLALSTKMSSDRAFARQLQRKKWL